MRWIDTPRFSVYQKLHLRTVRHDRKFPFIHLGEPILAAHWKLRLFIEGAIFVIVVTDILSIVVFPPAYVHGLVYAIFQYRQIPNGAHGTSYVLVLVMVVIATLKWDDALKGAMYGGLMVFIHEGLWFIPYYWSNWGDLNIPLDAGFALWLLSMSLVAHRKYHMKVWMKGLYLYTGYLGGWFALGFPITVKNTSRIFFATPFYGVLWVEAIEVTGWFLIFFVFLYGLKLNESHGWKFLEQFKGIHLKHLVRSLASNKLRLRGNTRLVHVSILVLIALGLVMMAIPVVHASVAVTHTGQATCQACISRTVVLTVDSVGDMIVVTFGGQDTDASAWPGKSTTATGVTDTFGDTFTQAVSVLGLDPAPAFCNTGGCEGASIWSTTSLSSGSDTITITVAASDTFTFIFGTALDVVGASPPALATATGACLLSNPIVCTGSGATTSTSNSFGSNTIEVSAADFAGTAGVSSPAPWVAVGIQAAQGGASEYGTTITSPTNYPWNQNSNAWVDAGAVFGPPTTTTVTTIVAPSAFSLNYWLYPVLFLGLYDAFFLASALLNGVSTKGLIYLLLSGFVLGSMLSIMMGMTDFELTVLSLIVFFVWVYRMKS